MAITPAVNTFVIYSRTGELIMQKRNYVNPNSESGAPVSNAGKLSLFGHVLTDSLSNDVQDDFTKEFAGWSALRQLKLMGLVEDTEHQRYNAVYLSEDCFEEIAEHQCYKGGKASSMLNQLFQIQGCGLCSINQADYRAAAAAGDITDISVKIIEELKLFS